ncbi:MAG: hypothetical protein JWO05_2403 [Gemmatimonadetes bacterium]|nr:hypothetical protein [Gemmatimonadota bacterium]
MTSTLRTDTEPPSLTPVPDGSPEPVGGSPELSDALRQDRADLQSEVILWQRWVRYAAMLTFWLASVLLSQVPQESALLPLTLVIGAYVAVVLGTSLYVQRTTSNVLRAWLPAILATADVAATAAIFYFASSPEHIDRMLVIGLAQVQLTVFYYGRRLGAWSIALNVGAYLLATLVITPFMPGPQPHAFDVALDAAVFAGISGLLVHVFGRFRERMNRLRLFCKLAEEGDFSGRLALEEERRPDDLTLLARSLDTMRNRLAEQIGTDALTGCLNRRALEHRLRADWRHAKRRGSQVAVVALDMDHFKEINDTRGHPVGDIVLQQLSGIMKATARDTDAVARLGGDEFVVLLPDTGWQGAVTFAERLRRRVDDFSFGPPGGGLAVTISVGVALARGTDPISPEMLLQEADRSLYKAKLGGRNRVYA